MPDKMYEAYGDRAQHEGIGDWRAIPVDLGEDKPDRMPRYGAVTPGVIVRTDDAILDDVLDRLADDGELDSREINVSVAAGEVTLEGSVDTRFAKRHAEILTEAVPGVRDVHNLLRIMPQHATEFE